MGRTVNVIPNSYVPKTAEKFKEKLADAIISRIDALGITAFQLAKTYKSIRRGDIANLRRGEFWRYGIYRLIAIGETLGLDMEMEIR